MKKYVKFEKDFLREYIKITFFKKYDRKLVDFFLDEYFKVRYYDFLEKNISVNITNYIENQFKDQEFDDNRVSIFKEFLPIILCVKFIIMLCNVSYKKGTYSFFIKIVLTTPIGLISLRFCFTL